MTSLQVLNKIINDKSFAIVQDNSLEQAHFAGYENEFVFIKEHVEQYGTVPDLETMLNHFPAFQPLDVQESERYLVDTLQEEYLYYKSVEVVQTVAELLKSDANSAVEYLRSKMSELNPCNTFNAQDIMAQAAKRLQLHEHKRTAESPWYIPTGFNELDAVLHGWARGEELVVLFARTGQGKSWVLAKTLSHAWKSGFRVGYVSPEMSADKIGYRVDTLLGNFSNSALIWGNTVNGYAQHIDELSKSTTPFLVATPQDFQKRITVSKLRQFIVSNKLDILGVDGITYMTDERYKKGDNKTTTLTNISEDLLQLSNELNVPILIVVQSNRGGVKDEEQDGTPELEHIRDSDGIAQNATKVIALRQTGAGLEFGIKKHRDGMVGGKVVYQWDIDKGEFLSIPQSPHTAPKRTSPKEETDVADVF